MSTWLAFDAGSPVTSAAVARSGAVLGGSSGESRTGPSLLHHIDDSLRQAGVSARSLDGIVALSGPGSFTGIRVGLATALGFRAALDVPVFGLSNLAALALHSDPDGSPLVLALVDALREEWFVQEFRRDRKRLAALGEPQRLSGATVALAAGAVITAHASQILPIHLAEHGVTRVTALATAAAVSASAGKLQGLLSADLQPLYLRAFTPRTPAPRPLLQQ